MLFYEREILGDPQIFHFTRQQKLCAIRMATKYFILNSEQYKTFKVMALWILLLSY